MIIEPSCGDGRLLHLLGAMGQQVVGCDIDIIALSQARELTAPLGNISTLHSDFLVTTKESILACAGVTSDSKIIAIGGPPYTAGGGTGRVEKSSGRELPHQFIAHCVNALSCDVILFLLPVRFCREDVISQVERDIGRIEIIENEFDCEKICFQTDAEWSLRLLRPANDRFDFVERSVVQPVVFFHLTKK